MPPTEEELIRLHAAHAERAFRFAWSITKDQTLAEDVVQAILLIGPPAKMPQTMAGCQRRMGFGSSST